MFYRHFWVCSYSLFRVCFYFVRFFHCKVYSANFQGVKGRQALYGLLVHSLADGFAVGVACGANEARMTQIVALTMLLHKGPVAFGLSSFLRGSGWNVKQLVLGLAGFKEAMVVY